MISYSYIATAKSPCRECVHADKCKLTQEPCISCTLPRDWVDRVWPGAKNTEYDHTEYPTRNAITGVWHSGTVNEDGDGTGEILEEFENDTN